MFVQFIQLLELNIQFLIYYFYLLINYLLSISRNIYIFTYDYFFGNEKFNLSTPNLYNYSIKKLNHNSKILDFGCGNGICYKNKNVIENIKNNNLQIIGIDIDKIYIKQCTKRIKENGLQDYVEIKLINIFNYKLEKDEDKFDYVIFSESAPLLSNELLTNIIKYIDDNLIKSDGKIVFINNLSESNNPMKKFKPYLKYISLIDFGRLLSKEEFILIAKNMNKNICINLIDSMKFTEILSFFKLYFLYYIAKLFGISDYNVEQYEIILNNKNNIE